MDGTLRSWLPPHQEIILPARDGLTRATEQNLVLHVGMAVPRVTVKESAMGWRHQLIFRASHTVVFAARCATGNQTKFASLRNASG
jgi:hypothetical protein